jgi:tetratricopeptide (TPR) repeat protein
MTDSFRIKVIRDIVNELPGVTGGRFEQLGYDLMTAIHPTEWMRRGTTIEGSPRGYTVDTSADGGSLVAEMSSDREYFDGELAKPVADFNHAIAEHPDAKRIWLLSAQEPGAGATTRVANLISKLRAENAGVGQLEILGARSIAEIIFAHLGNERFVASLSKTLDCIGRLAEEYSFSHAVPDQPDYIARVELETAITERLSRESFVFLRGISGAGKSALAARVSNNLRSTFENVIWLDAQTLTNLDHLADVDVRRTGTRHNILNLIRTTPCLLVLDDLSVDGDRLKSLNLSASKILVTCQATGDPDAITVGDLNATESRALLLAHVSVDDATVGRVLECIGGYPLLLRALGLLGRDEGWPAVLECCEDAVSSIEDERHEKVCQRILARHRGSIATELQFIRWSASPRFHSELARACVSSRAVSNLEKRGFLSATNFGIARVHDIVYRAIVAVVDVEPESSSKFRERLETLVRADCDSEQDLLHRLARLHGALFKRLAREHRAPSFVYAVALAREGDDSIDLLGSPVAEAEAVVARGDTSGMMLELRSIIEAVEALFTLRSAKFGPESARSALTEDILAFERLLAAEFLRPEQRFMFTHHRAKMLERLQRYEEAENGFRTLLGQDPTYSAARIQLARLLAKDGRRREAVEECRTILAARDRDPTSVSINVLLESLRCMANAGAEDLPSLERHIMVGLAAAREVDRALAYRLIASVAQKAWFPAPEMVLRMFESVQWRDSVPAPHERFDWAQAHKLAAKAEGLVEKPDEQRRREFLTVADEMYEKVEAPKQFQLVQHAECLLLMRRFADADGRLEEVLSNARDGWWEQRKAQAQHGLGALDDAFRWINAAIANLGSKAPSAFFADRARIRRSLGDSSAADDLRLAIGNEPLGRYRSQLEEELRAFESSN